MFVVNEVYTLPGEGSLCYKLYTGCQGPNVSEKLKKKVAKDSKDIERHQSHELMTSNIEISEKDIKWTNKPTTESVEDEDDEDGKDVGDVNVDNEA
ncbi:hypothetical protein AAMO2058_001691100 [Amorphochlora amoebiformis]